MIADKITDLIGDTPLLKIPAEVHGFERVTLYAKLEMLNPFGSLKDRTAWGIIRDEIESLRNSGKTIVENSSGNTAKALQAIAGTYGVNVRLVTGLARVKEQRDAMVHLGAEVEEFASASDCFDPNDPNDPQYLIQKAVQSNPERYFFPSQFTNTKNVAIHYETTGAEILRDLGHVDLYIGGLGTTGSSLGINRRLKEANPRTTCVGVTAEKGHFIPGIRSLDQMWESGLFEKENYDTIMPLREKEAIEAMMTLNRRIGLMCGPSSGANYLGALHYLRDNLPKIEGNVTAVFLACDRVEWYYSYIRERAPEIFRETPRPASFAAFDFNPFQGAPAIQPDQLESWMAENKPLVIDVRSKIAFNLGHLRNSMNIPQPIFESMIDEARPFTEDRPILLVCAVGEKTKKHAAYLVKQGYRAFSLDKGMRGIKTPDRSAPPRPAVGA